MYLGQPDYAHNTPPVLGVLAANLGTPDAPTPGALRRYLAQFFADPRVFEFPRLTWWLLSNFVILNVRPRRSAALYQTIWTDAGSPLLVIGRRQASALEAALQPRFDIPVKVALGMRYGSPSIPAALDELRRANVRWLVVLPLFPQYSASTVASVFDAVANTLKRWRWLPDLRLITHYHDDPGYIAALTNSVREHWAAHGRAERLLFSFHGIPQRYFTSGDPYYCECHKTARLVAEALDLPEDRWLLAFQSRFGREEWLKPYTQTTLEEWGRGGLTSVDVICPGFSADCLETLQEIALENRHVFTEAGGGHYRYIPALNDRPDHIQALAGVVLRHTTGWVETPWQSNGHAPVLHRPSERPSEKTSIMQSAQ